MSRIQQKILFLAPQKFFRVTTLYWFNLYLRLAKYPVIWRRYTPCYPVFDKLAIRDIFRIDHLLSFWYIIGTAVFLNRPEQNNVLLE